MIRFKNALVALFQSFYGKKSFIPFSERKGNTAINSTKKFVCPIQSENSMDCVHHIDHWGSELGRTLGNRVWRIRIWSQMFDQGSKEHRFNPNDFEEYLRLGKFGYVYSTEENRISFIWI